MTRGRKKSYEQMLRFQITLAKHLDALDSLDNYLAKRIENDDRDNLHVLFQRQRQALSYSLKLMRGQIEWCERTLIQMERDGET